MSHTILLEQPQGLNSRTYRDYDNMGKCADYLVKLYERKLRQMNPGVKQLSYDVSDIYKFLDTYEDIAVLSFQKSTNTYVPHDKKWIKQQIFKHVKHQASWYIDLIVYT